MNGVFSFQVTEAKHYSYVEIGLCGRAHVSWIGGPSAPLQIFLYSAKREYVNLSTIVWSEQQAAPNGMLYPGSYNFPFRFTFPSGRLPPTFGNSTGSIRYGVEGRIGMGDPKFDHVIRVDVPLSEVVDTNIPQFQIPARAAATKTVRCWSCASGPITLTAETPRTGFCIGEAIPLNVHLENGSSRQVQISATLYQKVSFKAEEYCRTYDRRPLMHQSNTLHLEFFAAGEYRAGDGRQVLSLLSGPMQPRSSSTWSPEDELIVPLVEPTLTSCDIINVAYLLIVAVGSSCSVHIPIVIGNVPGQDSTPQ